MDIEAANFEPKKPLMPPIDLTLAVNFIPAVICLCKAALMAFSLNTLDPGEHLGGFVIFVMVLNIDRAVSCARIFDENAVQCCILASWVINFLRGLAASPRPVGPIATFLWLLFSFLLVVEPRRVQEFFVMYGKGSGGTAKRVLPGIITSVFVLVLAFTHQSHETPIVKGCRTLSFACLCVAWVYIVSIWRPKPRHNGNNGNCVFESHLLLSRFCPVLYVHWIAALVYGLGCLVALVYHYVQIHVSRSVELAMEDPPHQSYQNYQEHQSLHTYHEKNDTSVSVALLSDSAMSVPANQSYQTQLNHSNVRNVPLIVTTALSCKEPIETIAEDDEDLEALFRAACQNRQCTNLQP